MSSDTPPSIPPRKSGSDTSSTEQAGTPGPAADKRSGSVGSTTAAAGSTSTATATPEAPRPADKATTSRTSTSAAVQRTTAPPASSGAASAGTPASAPRTTESPTARPSSSERSSSDRPAATATSAKPATAAGLAAGPRRVRLAISRVDPWSVMKLSFLISVAVGIMIVVATAVVWLTLDSLNVFSALNDLVTEILADSNIDLMQYIEFSRVISVATLVAVVDVFLMTALATLGAFLYNITAALVGGVHVTMTDE